MDNYTGVKARSCLGLIVSIVILISCWGFRAVRLLGYASKAIHAQPTQSAAPIPHTSIAPIGTVEPTPHPTAGPFTDADAVRRYLLWIETTYNPFVDAINANQAARKEQDTRSGLCGVALYDASALLREANNQRPPAGLRQTHLDMTRMFQEWEAARTEMAQFCSGSDDANDKVASRIQTIVDLSVGVAENLDSAVTWLNGTHVTCVEIFTVSVDTANLRDGPGTNYRVLGVAHKGDRFQVGEPKSNTEWLHVSNVSGQWFWISGKLGEIRQSCTPP